MIALSELTIGELAAFIAEHLRSKGVETVLVGGACISIYSANEYSSFDLDFIITGSSTRKTVRDALNEINFTEENRYFVNPHTPFFVDVAVGYGGVFVIETKSHGGKVTNNGNQLLLNGSAPEKDFINQTWSQTYHIKNLLKQKLGRDIPVNPVLCFTNAFVQVRGTVKGVSVVNGGYLNTHIARQKPVLNKSEIAQVVASFKIETKAKESDKKLCPTCKTELVLRQIKSGPDIGQTFYGCVPCRKKYPVDVSQVA